MHAYCEHTYTVRPNPRLRHIRSKRYAVVVLLGISLLLSTNILRILFLSNAAITNALSPNPQARTNTELSSYHTSSPTYQTQTYALTSTPPDGIDQDAAAIIAASSQTTQNKTPGECSGSPYVLPAAQELSTVSNGLVKNTDQPTYYQVYGNSLSEIRAAIANCPYRKAAGAYQAETSYQLNWRYSTVAIGNNQCKLTNVQIGLHINQLMPLYVPTEKTPSSLASRWATYANNLATHEAGHIAFDTRYAEKLLAALQQSGPLDCSLISRHAQTTIDSYITMLDSANDLYDSQTNHGATQGALL